MAFVIHHTRDFEGTYYIEIAPRAYLGKHWQPSSLFIAEDDFNVTESLIDKCVSNYNPYGATDISTTVGQMLIMEWRTAAYLLVNDDSKASNILHHKCSRYRKDKEPWLEQNRVKIANMLLELASSCEKLLNTHGGFCILGL